MRSLLTGHKPVHLLLVDDDPELLKLLGLHLASEGYSAVAAESGAEGLQILNREKVDLVISGLRTDEMDGIQLFTEIRRVQPGTPVIILTVYGPIPDAIAVTQQGVFSFLTKPVDKDALYQAIDNALEQSAPAAGERWHEVIVTRSPLMLRLLEQARLVAQSGISVLTNGQSGTGKKIFAQAVHNASPRNSRPFIAIDCGALSEQLLESELFGHMRDAFTGAVSSREGLFQAAEGGTLFLDEVGDMLAPLQVKLLRMLQERKVRPLGSNRDIDINMRIISVTHHDLSKVMTHGEFREDLYYRLNVISLKIPVLAERTEDIPLLANHLLRQAAERHKPFVRMFSAGAIKHLMTANWPGNVCQSVNVIEQCVVLASSPVISDALMERTLEDENTALSTFVEARNQLELDYLRELLQITKDNVTHTARMAGRNRTEFYKLLSRHELDADNFEERIGVTCYVQQIRRQTTFPRNSMRKIDTIIKPFKLNDIREALTKVGITGMTVTGMKGFDRRKGHTKLYHGVGYMADSLPKVKIEIVVPDDVVDTCVDTIIRAAQTSKIGDGGVFVFDVARVIHIHTGEEDDVAIRIASRVTGCFHPTTSNCSILCRPKHS